MEVVLSHRAHRARPPLRGGAALAVRLQQVVGTHGVPVRKPRVLLTRVQLSGRTPIGPRGLVEYTPLGRVAVEAGELTRVGPLVVARGVVRGGSKWW